LAAKQDPALADGLRARLALYRGKQPWHRTTSDLVPSR
jgi:hypothetical protein